MFKTLKKKTLKVCSLLSARHSIKAFEHKLQGKRLRCIIHYKLAKLHLTICFLLEEETDKPNKGVIKC